MHKIQVLRTTPHLYLKMALDIVVTGPDGTDHYPWLLNPSSPLYAVKGDNTVDNIENVDIDTHSPGTYTITVSNKGLLTNGFPVFSPDYEAIQKFFTHSHRF